MSDQLPKKVMLICNTDGALYVFRGPIIRRLLEQGVDVVSISGASQYIQRLNELGVRTHESDFDRHSLSVVKNLKLLGEIAKVVGSEAPGIVHSFTHKAAILGSLAAFLSGVPKVFITITGLGTLFVGGGFRRRIARTLLIWQYRIVSRFVDGVFFQNPDDLQHFLELRAVPPEKAVLTNGSGIDLTEYPLPIASKVEASKVRLSAEISEELRDRLVVLFPARAVKEKGVVEFYEAAEALRRECNGRFVFVHVGMIDASAASGLTLQALRQLASRANVHYLGFKDDIQDYMLAADVVCLPSYREGVPRSLIEALALGKTIVTTDAPGCRETVVEGGNGFLCRVESHESLAEALGRVTHSFVQSAGPKSRRLCEEKFDVNQLITMTFTRYLK